MDNRYLENVINEMQPFLDENGFKLVDGVYKNDKKAAAVEYSDERQMYILKTADIAEDYDEAIEKINASSFTEEQKTVLKAQAQANKELALSQAKASADQIQKNREARKGFFDGNDSKKDNKKARKVFKEIDDIL